jgi:hypothetical protein
MTWPVETGVGRRGAGGGGVETGGRYLSLSGRLCCKASSRGVGSVGSTHDCVVGSHCVPVGSAYAMGFPRTYA